MEYNDIKQIIDNNIKTNTSQEITAIVANAVMTAMIDYTRDSFTEAMNQGAGGGAFSWLDVRADTVIPYPPMSAGRARVVRILKDGVEYEDGEATIGGVNGITIKRHALVICLEATNESANDGSQEAVGDRFAVINVDGSGSTPYGAVRGKGFIGRSVKANVSGSYVIDFDDMAEHYILTMTDNTSITFDNMITEDETVVITLTVTGNYSLLLPSFLVASFENDDYDGSVNNEIVINIKRGGANPLGYYTLKNYEI